MNQVKWCIEQAISLHCLTNIYIFLVNCYTLLPVGGGCWYVFNSCERVLQTFFSFTVGSRVRGRKGSKPHSFLEELRQIQSLGHYRVIWQVRKCRTVCLENNIVDIPPIILMYMSVILITVTVNSYCSCRLNANAFFKSPSTYSTCLREIFWLGLAIDTVM